MLRYTLDLKTIFIAHAEANHGFACRLTEFLEFGCNVNCYKDEGLIASGEDIIGKVEEGITADAVVLLLSDASWPVRMPRERWEPVLFEKTREAGVELLTVLLGECPFPALLRRRNFFDATTNPNMAMRLLKRWVWQAERGMSHSLMPTVSSDLEELYYGLADRSGRMEASGADATRFSKEAAQEFEAVFWIPCHRRSLAQVAGELGTQLGVTLDGTVEQNCSKIRELLSQRRCLLVLDAPEQEYLPELIPSGRSSTLVVWEPVSVLDTPNSLWYARKLVGSRRYAEAYELLQELLSSDISPEQCARELISICEHWDRVEEAESLRACCGPAPAVQLSLF